MARLARLAPLRRFRAVVDNSPSFFDSLLTITSKAEPLSHHFNQLLPFTAPFIRQKHIRQQPQDHVHAFFDPAVVGERQWSRVAPCLSCECADPTVPLLPDRVWRRRESPEFFQSEESMDLPGIIDWEVESDVRLTESRRGAANPAP